MIMLTEQITIEELRSIAETGFGEMVKAVVDVDRGIVALDAELHSDLEAHCLENGSSQKSLWGINYYPNVELFKNLDLAAQELHNRGRYLIGTSPHSKKSSN